MPSDVSSFPAPDHDHRRCRQSVLAMAEARCRAEGLRLTPLRRRVLAIVCSSHVPMRAYQILDAMTGEGRRVAPMTVYRALDFLQAHQLVHRLASLNAYIACSCADPHQGSQFFICEACRKVAEIADPALDRALRECGRRSGFTVGHPIVELSGVCGHCRDPSP